MLQSGQAAGDTGSLRLLAEHVQATLMQPVEQLLLVDYPLRSPPAADADDPGLAFKLDEVSVSLKVGVLASSLIPEASVVVQKRHPFTGNIYTQKRLGTVRTRFHILEMF